MHLQSISRRAWALALLFVLTLPTFAGRKASTKPGTYEDWGPDIDKIEIVKTFQRSAYGKIVVLKMDVSSVAEKGDADLADKVDSVLGEATGPFVEGIASEADKLEVAEGAPTTEAGTLIVRTKVTTMDPGSRSKRMWVGYGAGAARAAIEGELVDAASGDVLVRFTQERRSGIERFGRGSSYEEIMKRNLVAVGEDVGNLLNEF
jgi:hypothetical protein